MMTEISRNDIDRIHDSIDGVHSAVRESEIRLRTAIDSNRVESDKIYVREDRVKLVEARLDAQADELNRLIRGQDWWKKALITEGLAVIGGIFLLILAASGVFK
jgi:hypothetical protein